MLREYPPTTPLMPSSNVPPLSLQSLPDSFAHKLSPHLLRKSSLFEPPSSHELLLERGVTQDTWATPGSPRAQDYLKYLLDQAATQRFESEFEVLGKLGKGGFASVYKVRNRLDQVCYAVKKITLKVPKTPDKFEKELGKMLREVRHLAKARHKNIVGYNQAWVEVTRSRLPSGEHDEPSPPISDTDSEASKEDESFIESDGLSGIEMVGLDEEEKAPISLPSQRNKKSSGIFEGIEKVILYIQMEICEDTLEAYLMKRNRQLTTNKVKYNILPETERAKVKQLLEGLHYVHHKAGLIHRDLKPSNIFISQKILKIGDFGLATHLEGELPYAFITSPVIKPIDAPALLDYHEDPADAPFFEDHQEEDKHDIAFVVQSSQPGFIEPGSLPLFERPKQYIVNEATCLSEKGEEPSPSCSSDMLQLSKRSGCCEHSLHPNRTSNIGTRTYAAPEQLKGENYGQKADIYSLGLILIELFCPFATNMQKVDVLHKSKHGKLPSQFMKSCPSEAKIIERMLSPQPEQRPCISELQDLFNRGRLCSSTLHIQSPVIYNPLSPLPPSSLPLMRKVKSAHTEDISQAKQYKLRVGVREEDQESYACRYLLVEDGKLKIMKSKTALKASRIYNIKEIAVSEVSYAQCPRHSSPLHAGSEDSTQNSTNTNLSRSPETRSPPLFHSPGGGPPPRILGFMQQEVVAMCPLMLEPPQPRELKIMHPELETMYLRLAEEEFSLDSPADLQFERLLNLLDH